MIHNLPVSESTVHWGYFDAGVEPVLRIKSGDTVELETTCGQLGILRSIGVPENVIPQSLKEIDLKVTVKGPGPHILTGPIFIDGARLNEVLEVSIDEIVPTVPFAWNCFLPEAGALMDDYAYSRNWLLRIDAKEKLVHYQKFAIPLRPFFGVMGVAPSKSEGRISSTPPGSHGGNMDIKDLTYGTKLFLPVHSPGALFSLGDGHACQGDGEVDSSAAETCLKSKLTFRLWPDLKMKWPWAETNTHIITMGFHEDLDEACKLATRNMIEFLVHSWGMNPDEAYTLCSLAANLRVSQVVNTVKGVHAMLPKDIYSSRSS
jgi:acetamidase/formamidase